MFVVQPLEIEDADLLATNVAESEHAAWDVSTTYASGDIVYLVSTHREYISLQGSNLGNDPSSAGGAAFWEDIGATNRWRAFDYQSKRKVQNADSITFDIAVPGIVTAVGFVGLAGADVSMLFLDGEGNPAQEQSATLVDTSDIVSWATWATWEPVSTDLAIFDGLLALAGTTLRVTINNSGGTAEVGQIVFGKRVEIGPVLKGAFPESIPLSTFERDQFGTAKIVPRGYFKDITYYVRVSHGDEARVQRIIDNQMSSPALFYLNAADDGRGLTIFGTPTESLEVVPELKAPAVGRFIVTELI